MLDGTLDRLCRDFKLPAIYSKTHFPHDFMNRVIRPPPGLTAEQAKEYIDRQRFYYVGPTPSSEYWPGHRVPAEFKAADCVFDVAALSKHYLSLDVVSLCMTWYKFEVMLRTAFPSLDLALSNYLTAPHLSYSIVVSHLPRDVGVIKSRDVSRFIRLAVQGGRCIAQKARFTSASYRDFINTFDAEPDISRVPLKH